jgi:DNA processing protein
LSEGGRLEPLLRLALTPGVGPTRIATLVEAFGDADAVLRAPVERLRQIDGVGPKLAERVASAAGAAAGERARDTLRRLERLGAHLLTPADPRYPAAFGAVNQPPFILFTVGDLDLLQRPMVAVVGTRTPTSYGVSVTTRIASDLAEAAYGVVSGMAAGIDAAAHAASLDAGAGSIGVLGQGIDRVYPPENRELFTRMRREGLLISEFAPGEPPMAGHFPRRNRLIAALGAGVLVVEMSLKSGAQHTVNFALDLGREVFAVPGPIGSPVSEGTNQLIRDGACLVTRTADILEALGGAPAAPRAEPAPWRGAHPQPPAPSPPPLPPVEGDEKQVVATLRTGPRHVDEIVAESGIPAGRILSLLLGLELRGLVRSLPGKRFDLAVG